MSNSPSSPIRPLNVGNVVSAGLVLYRSNLKKYFNISLIASLWGFPAFIGIVVLYFSFLLSRFNSIENPAFRNAIESSGYGPIAQLVQQFNSVLPILSPILFIASIYFSAKFFANAALISRLAYQELASQPESANDARPKVLPRLWAYLWVSIQVGLRIYALCLALAFAGGITIAVVGAAVRSTPIVILLSVALGVAIVYLLVWFYSRWFIAEVPLAVEPRLTANESVKRSWDLTANSVGRVQLIVFVAFLVTIPIVAITGYIPDLILGFIPPDSPGFWIVYIINLGFSLMGGVLVLPFWQSIKAVMYYDLRSRREGIDLQLRDR